MKIVIFSIGGLLSLALIYLYLLEKLAGDDLVIATQDSTTLLSDTQSTSIACIKKDTETTTVILENETKIINKVQAFTTAKTPSEIKKLVTEVVEKITPTEKINPSIVTDVPFTEFVNPSGFVNSEPFKLADYIGKKLILIEFITYTCINCQRTFPYMQQWHEKYKDDGLLVIGIHTPEFSYERNRSNVIAAMQKEGITFPIVQDNDYETWNAYKNRFWPRRYIIDYNGNIVFDHIGEGAYSQTEEVIQRLLTSNPNGI